uniref:Cytosol aminopeptidase n=1 Tax=Biomphalaria glabrata TaxID=6526 RepID=A0A2C9KE70_BIOGL
MCTNRVFLRLNVLILKQHSNFKLSLVWQHNSRFFSMSALQSKGLVLGVYEPKEKDGKFILTPTAQVFNQTSGGQLESILKIAGKKLKTGKSRLLYGIGEAYSTIAVANLGKQDAGYDADEQVDQGKENVRTAVASAVVSLRDSGETQVDIEPCGDAEAAAEGTFLSLYSFDDLRQEEKRKPSVDVNLVTLGLSEEVIASTKTSWSKGQTLASAQNLARKLKENPANLMTPTIFCEEVKKNFEGLPNVEVIVRDKEWAEAQKMGSFLSVSRGSEEPPKFLEIHYNGGNPADPPVVFVGKGVTFDSGGISIKPSGDMDKMRADMGGAACVISSILAAVKLGLPLNIKGFTPLTENMPSGKATKPGDVVVARNGKTIMVNNTDAEGRLILADTLCYAETFNPRLILDIATLTGAVVIALGGVVSAAYTKSDHLWETLHNAGKVTGDRMWRMPLLKYYTGLVTEGVIADVNNISKKAREAGSCTAAAFLKEFVSTDNWIHVDMAGVMHNSDEVPYLGSGMSGRPTRTLFQFLESLSKQQA